MKKIIFILLYWVALFSFMSSCTNEEDDLFPQSSAERLNAAVTDNTSLLMSASNGWVLQYFPNPDTEGYTYLMKFGKDSVTIAGQNKYVNGGAYSEEISCWEIIADDGPVLTLNSYNTIFHLFANPVDPNGDEKKLGVGLKGDYEFIILNSDKEQNTIKLKGKKWGSYLFMTKLDDNVVWTDYMNEIKAMNSFLFNGTQNKIVLHENADVRELYDGSTGIFKTILPGGDLISEAIKKPFIVTVEGIRFYADSIPEMVYNREKDMLVAKNGDENVYIEGCPKYQYMAEQMTAGKRWTFAKNSSMSTNISSIYARIDDAFKSKVYGSLVSVSLGYVSGKTALILQYRYKNNKNQIVSANAYYYYDQAGTGDEISLVYSGSSAGDETIKNNYDGISDLINLFASSFKLQVPDGATNLNLANIKLVSDGNTWVVVSL